MSRNVDLAGKAVAYFFIAAFLGFFIYSIYIGKWSVGLFVTGFILVGFLLFLFVKRTDRPRRNFGYVHFSLGIGLVLIGLIQIIIGEVNRGFVSLFTGVLFLAGGLYQARMN